MSTSTVPGYVVSLDLGDGKPLILEPYAADEEFSVQPPLTGEGFAFFHWAVVTRRKFHPRVDWPLFPTGYLCKECRIAWRYRNP